MTTNPRSDRDEGDVDVTRVGIRDLRHNLSEYVRRARAGETIAITDRGTQVARLVPEPAPTRSIIDQGIAEGWITPPDGWPGPHPQRQLRPPWPVPVGSPTSAEILDDLRRDADGT